MTVKWFYIILIERGKISYVYMEVNRVFGWKVPKYKNMYKIKKTQPPKRGNMQNLEGGGKRMFRIAICDDEKIFRDDLKEILIRYMTDRGIMLEIDTFSSGKEFVELGIEMVKYKIVFLDINMDELDGIMTAKKIRENSKDMFIVFVTAFVNYTIEGYKVDAVRYILKDNKNLFASVYECMDAIHEKMDYKITWAEFDFCEGTRKVSLNRILYIESKLHKLEFHVMEDCLQKYTLQGTLNEIDDKFAGNDFLRIHQSFLVNMKFIKNISRYRVLLNNGILLDIARARYKYVEEKFIAYRGEV